MKDRQHITTHLVDVRRLPSSRNGNPRYAVETTVGTYRTGIDSGVAYALNEGMAPRPVTLTLDRQEQIIGVDLHDGADR